MKIIRWFLSHFFLILLIVAVIYGYMFWGNLAGEDTPAGKALAYLSSEFVEVEEFIAAVKAKQAKLSADKEQAPAEVAAVPDEKVVTSRKIEQQPVSISYRHNQMRVKQNSAGDIETQREVPQVVASLAQDSDQAKQSVRQPVRQRAAPALPIPQGEMAQNNVPSAAVSSRSAAERSNAQDKFVSTELEQQLDNVDGQGKVINKSMRSDAIRTSWVTARKSFYQRNYALSEQSYRDVIDNTSDNFDAYGELGNVYFNQGKKEQAAGAYFEAAAILVRKGQIGRATSLMGLLRHLDQSKADDLKKLIDSAVS